MMRRMVSCSGQTHAQPRFVYRNDGNATLFDELKLVEVLTPSLAQMNDVF